MRLSRPAHTALVAVLLFAPTVAQGPLPAEQPDEVKEPPAPAPTKEGEGVLALHAAKVLTAALEGEQVIDGGTVLVEDGKILAVGERDEIEVPEGAEVRDLGDQWIMPGLVELHCHVGAPVDMFPVEINAPVYLANPGLRVSASVVPENRHLRRGLAGGVTTVLYIPGSASNVGGQGVLLKIGHDTYEEMELRNPGSLKVAQAGNPESWGPGVARSFQNWHTRNLFRRGRAYAERWEAFERGEGEEPLVDLQLEVFRDLFAHRTQISTHTQFYQVVMTTIRMLRVEFGLDVYLDHGTFDGFRAAELAEEEGVPAIIGPRMLTRSVNFPGHGAYDTDGRILGICAEYQRRGHKHIGFNTDCVDDGTRFNVPAQEELSLQAAMAQRYGMTDFDLESVRGLTIIPAMAAGLEERLGSLEPGKDADLVVLEGDPADPRTAVSLVFTDGEVVYDPEVDGRLW
ncbi:MAG: amidohydrolase family protein [Planctomycetota bacterium]